jgi:hypothetical protein
MGVMNKITAVTTGWRTPFYFRGSRHWPARLSFFVRSHENRHGDSRAAGKKERI